MLHYWGNLVLLYCGAAVKDKRYLRLEAGGKMQKFKIQMTNDQSEISQVKVQMEKSLGERKNEV